MAKTLFSHGTIVSSAFLNSVYGQGAAGGHVHDGGDNDGHAEKVDLGAHTSGTINLGTQTSGTINLETQTSGTIDLETQVRGVLPAAHLPTLSDPLKQFTVGGSLTPPDSSDTLDQFIYVFSAISPFYAPAGSKVSLDIRFIYHADTDAANQITGMCCIAPVPDSGVDTAFLVNRTTHGWLIHDNYALPGLTWSVAPFPPPPGGWDTNNPDPYRPFLRGGLFTVRNYPLPASNNDVYCIAVGVQLDGLASRPTFNSLFNAHPYIAATVAIS